MLLWQISSFELSMQRDMNLVRELLLRLEPLPVHFDNPMPLDVGKPPHDIPGYTNEQIAYHMRIMAQGDLIAYSGFSGQDGVHIPRFLGLSWLGHELIDDVRDTETWEDTKKKIGKIGGASFQVIWEIAKAYMRSKGVG
jgi:Hypothetical protein (DUF2513)